MCRVPVCIANEILILGTIIISCQQTSTLMQLAISVDRAFNELQNDSHFGLGVLCIVEDTNVKIPLAGMARTFWRCSSL